MTQPPSGPILALDSSTETATVAVGTGTALLAEAVFAAGARASSSLIPAMDWVLARAGLRPDQLAGVVVGGGPGSFTGLRVAAAAAKGIVHAMEIPLFAFPGLLASAVGASVAGDVVAMFDARRGDVYAARYRFEGSGGRAIEVVRSPEAESLDGLLETLSAEARPPALVAGEPALHARIAVDRPELRLHPLHLSAPRASALLWLVAHAPELGAVADAIAWEPEYVRAAGAERIAGEAAARGASA